MLQLKKYGDITQVLTRVKAEKPIPDNKEVLIEVKAIALNPIDIKIANGDLKAILPSIFKKPKLGFDISGTIESKASDVTNLKNGDEVLVRLPLHNGSGFSKFVSINSEYVALKPENLSFEQAAALPMASLTSLQALDYAKPKLGQSILIDSGSGGVGTFAIQYAKYLGLKVTAVTSHKNRALVESLGTDRVICYDLESFLDSDKKYDISFNIIGNANPLKSILATKKNGTVVSIGGPPDIRFIPKLKIGFLQKLLLYPLFGLTSLPVKLLAFFKGVRYYRFLTRSNGKQLDTVRKLVEKEKVSPVIDQVFPFEEYKKAFEHLKTNRAKGKIVLNQIKI